jgi:hypothetical protein
MICPQPLTLAKPILFADDTNIVISRSEIDYFQFCMNDVSLNVSAVLFFHPRALLQQ